MPPERRSAPLRIALLVLLALIYAVCYTAIKIGLTYAPPLRFAGLRAVVAAGALLAALAITTKPLLPPRWTWPWIGGLAATGTFLAYGGMFLSPGVTGAGVASVLGNTGPLLTIALAAIFLGERVTRARIGALVLGILGVSAIVWPAVADPAQAGVAAAALPLTAAAGFAGASVLFKRMEAGQELLAVVAWQMLLGGLPLLAVSAWLEPEARIAWSGPFLALLMFLGVIGSALAVWLWYWLVQRDDVGRLSLLLFAVPLLGLLLAVLVFSEPVGRLEMGGIAATLSATLITAREIVREGARQGSSTGSGMT